MTVEAFVSVSSVFLIYGNVVFKERILFVTFPVHKMLTLRKYRMRNAALVSVSSVLLIYGNVVYKKSFSCCYFSTSQKVDLEEM